MVLDGFWEIYVKLFCYSDFSQLKRIVGEVSWLTIAHDKGRPRV